MIWGFAVLAVALVASVVVLATANRPRVIHRRALRTVVVTRKDGSAFRGCLHESDRDVLVLKSAATLPDDIPIDGELLLLRSDIDTIQIP